MEELMNEIMTGDETWTGYYPDYFPEEVYDEGYTDSGYFPDEIYDMDSEIDVSASMQEPCQLEPEEEMQADSLQDVSLPESMTADSVLMDAETTLLFKELDSVEMYSGQYSRSALEKAVPPFLIEDVCREGETLLFSSVAKAGKSMLTLRAAVSVVTGIPFMDRYAIEDPGDVIIFDFEMNAAQTMIRLDDVCSALGVSPDEIAGRIHLIPMNAISSVNSVDQLLFYAKQKAKQYGAKMIIFDPLYCIAPNVDLISANQVAGLIKSFNRLATVTKTVVWINHHFSKDGGGAGRGAADKSYGSAALQWAVGAQMTLEPVNSDGFYNFSVPFARSSGVNGSESEVVVQFKYPLHVPVSGNVPKKKDMYAIHRNEVDAGVQARAEIIQQAIDKADREYGQGQWTKGMLYDLYAKMDSNPVKPQSLDKTYLPRLGYVCQKRNGESYWVRK